MLGPELLAAPREVDHVEVVGVLGAEDQGGRAGAGLAVAAVELELGRQVGVVSGRVERPAVQVPLVGRADDAVFVLGPRSVEEMPLAAVADLELRRCLAVPIGSLRRYDPLEP